MNAIEGSVFLMLTHGLVSPALFISIGLLYDRYQTRIYYEYGNLLSIMPLFGAFFFIFVLSNFSLPGTCSFVAEILIIIGVFKYDFLLASILFLSGALTLIYSL
jgi:NADH-quinone oxidoreductase subunit M